MRSAETSNCDISLRSICTITIRVPLIRPNRRRSPDKLRLRLSIADSNYDLVLPERRCQRAALRVPDDVALDFWHGYTSIGKAGDDLKAVPFLRMPDDVKASRGRARSSEHLGVGTRKPLPDKWHHCRWRITSNSCANARNSRLRGACSMRSQSSFDERNVLSSVGSGILSRISGVEKA